MNDCEELDKYVSGREYRHTEYCHYTRLDTIEEILRYKSFLMSCCSESFNDKVDRDQFGYSKLHYGMCFATGVNENLAMWYMYSGFDGKGGRLRFTKARVRQLVEKSVYELYKWEKVNGYYKLGEKVCDLIPGKNFKLIFRDIIYYKHNHESKVYDLKYNNSHIWGFNGEEFEKYRDKYNGFCKGLIWYYEKETRLLIQLKGTAKDQIKGEGKNFRIRLSFEHLKDKDYKITLAPEHPSVLEAIKHHKALKNYYKNSKRVYPSDYSGEIEMNFCKNCPLNKKGEVI